MRAIKAKAKASGLLMQRTEIGAPGHFDKCESTEEVVDTLLAYNLNPSYQVATEQDRQQLIHLLEAPV